jgi:glutaminase
MKARGVNLNLPNYDQKTALHFASEFGQLSTVQYLSQAGANINAKDRWGATPLTYSKLFPNITKYLVSLNAS